MSGGSAMSTVPSPGANPLTVAAVRCHRHRAPLLRPFVTAARRTDSVDYVVAEVELADGTIGQGSAAETVAVTGRSAAGAGQKSWGEVTHPSSPNSGGGGARGATIGACADDS